MKDIEHQKIVEEEESQKRAEERRHHEKEHQRKVWEDYAKCLEDQAVKGFDIGCTEPLEKRPEGLTLLTDIAKTHHDDLFEDVEHDDLAENAETFEDLDWNLANELGNRKQKGSKKDRKSKKKGKGPVEETQKTSNKYWTDDAPENRLLNLAAQMVAPFDEQNSGPQQQLYTDDNDILFDINKDVKFKLATDDNF